MGLFDQEIDVTCIWCDNQSCIKMIENPIFHDRSKHIGIKYHYIKDMVEKGAVKLQHVATEEQTADIFTKPLTGTKFEHFVVPESVWSQLMGICIILVKVSAWLTPHFASVPDHHCY